MDFKTVYDNTNKTAFYISLISSVGLLIAGLCVPPYGVIDPSLLKGVGELFGFATLATINNAINKGSKITFNKGNMNMTVDHDNDNEDDNASQTSVNPA